MNRKEWKVRKKTYEDICSSYELFDGNYEYIQLIERVMNKYLEGSFINIVNKVCTSIKTIEITLEESFIIRKYYAVTWVRMNLLDINPDEKKRIMDRILKWSTDDYRNKYAYPYHKGNLIYDFFINKSTIKFIKHDGYKFINDRDFFMSIPFDKRNTNYNILRENNINMPGYIVPFSHDISIGFINTFFLSYLLDNFSVGIKNTIFFRLNISMEGSKDLLYPDTKVKDEKGGITDSFQIRNPSEIPNKSGINYIKDWSKRDPKKTKYIYKIHNWKEDWNIMQVHALNEYEMCTLDLRVPDDHNYIFEKGDLFKKFLRNIIDIEKYVAINDSTAIEHWSSDIQKRYYHKIWQILLPGTIEIIENISSKI